MLVQPILEALGDARRVLVAGCGGGYDVIGAVPLVADLVAAGREVSVASMSFTYLNGLDGAVPISEHPNLYCVPGEASTGAAYCPEAWLARWLGERLGHAVPVWCFDKTGVQPLVGAYQYLVDRLRIDTIVLVDGGVDSLMRGDEASIGTPAEDLVSLAAVRAVSVPRKILSCVGLGTELRDGISHAHVLERIAELSRAGAYLGAAALVPGTDACRWYEAAHDYVVAGQPDQRQSHVHRVVRAAVRGEYGVQAPHVYVSPLTSLFWFFGLAEVADSNVLVPHLSRTVSIGEVTLLIEGIRKGMVIRPREPIPL